MNAHWKNQAEKRNSANRIAVRVLIVFALVLFIPRHVRLNRNHSDDNEPKVEISLTEVLNEKPLGALFPQKILEGYVLQDKPGIYGDGSNAVLEAIFSNEQLEDEMVIKIASREWFLSHEQESAELNKIYYREKLNETGSYIYLESGEHIISYSFSDRDIAQIDGFWDMVNSAEQINDYSSE